jgi:hypothetical protein
MTRGKPHEIPKTQKSQGENMFKLQNQTKFLQFSHKWLALLVLVAGLLMVLPALADEPDQAKPTPVGKVEINEVTETRPNIGPNYEGNVVGQNGYKVFNPGAIVAVPITGIDDARAIAAAQMRRGSTDAWLAWSWNFDWKKWGWDHIASHNSNSDLWEDEIWVDGALKITTDSSWRELCPNHTSGNNTTCTTRFFQVLPRTIKAESSHYFKKSGFVNSSFKSSDSA